MITTVNSNREGYKFETRLTGNPMLRLYCCVAEGENEEAAQLTQLQMLYRSRGRQLEDVRGELEQVRQESAKERRRLKHLLSVATGEDAHASHCTARTYLTSAF